jgi:hypothetical protein
MWVNGGPEILWPDTNWHNPGSSNDIPTEHLAGGGVCGRRFSAGRGSASPRTLCESVEDTPFEGNLIYIVISIT